MANLSFYEGEPRRTIEFLTQGINLNPKHPPEFSLLMMGLAYFMLGNNDAAIQWLQKYLENNPGFSYAYAYLAMASALEEEDEQAYAAVADALRLAPNTKLSAFDNPISSSPAAYREFHERKLVPAWRKAGLPE